MNLRDHSKILAIGHSNVSGFGALSQTEIFYRRRSWVNLLQVDLGLETRIVNGGRNGSQVGDWLPGGEHHALLQEQIVGSGAVLIHLSEADAMCPIHGVTPDTYPTAEEHLCNAEALVQEILSLEADVEDVVWIGPSRIVTGDSESQQRLEDFDAKLASELSAHYVRLYPKMADTGNLVLIDDQGQLGYPDPWHLTELGHGFLLDELLRALPSF